MPPKFDAFGSGEYPKTALASELLRHPSETEGVSLSERQLILQGRQSLVTDLERVGPAAFFTDSKGELQPRADQFLRVTIDGFGYGIRETYPDADAANGLNIVHFPGFGEVIEAGSAYNLHTSLATQFPGARVVSVASDGIGTISEKLTAGDVFEHGIKGMGEGRGKIIKALFGDQPVLVTSCSMGTAIVQEMLQDDLNYSHELNVYPLYYDTAVVEPGKTILLMGVAFPAHTIFDVSFELIRAVANGDFREIKELAKMVEQRGGDGLPMFVEAVSLMGGIAVKVTGKVSEVFKGTTISGISDPLRRNRKWGHVKSEYCPDLHIVTVPWRGHGMAMRGDNAGQKIRHEVDHYGIETLLLDAA
jgi:hypothetical protein